MMSRCYNKNVSHYKDYGGRGIKVHWRWHVFVNFADDMPPKPSKDTRWTIDRTDNNGDYEPNNVRWATYTMQLRNTRRQDEFTHLTGISRQRIQQLRYRRDGKCACCGQPSGGHTYCPKHGFKGKFQRDRTSDYSRRVY
jgi:hypothetical protein